MCNNCKLKKNYKNEEDESQSSSFHTQTRKKKTWKKNIFFQKDHLSPNSSHYCRHLPMAFSSSQGLRKALSLRKMKNRIWDSRNHTQHSFIEISPGDLEQTNQPNPFHINLSSHLFLFVMNLTTRRMVARQDQKNAWRIIVNYDMKKLKSMLRERNEF